MLRERRGNEYMLKVSRKHKKKKSHKLCLMSRELVCPYRVCNLSLCFVEETLPPEVGVAWDHHHYFVERCLKQFLFTQTQ